MHGYANEVVSVGEYESRMVIVPSLCGLGDYARKVTKSQSRLTVGIMAFVIERGKIADVVPLTDTVDLRTEEML